MKDKALRKKQIIIRITEDEYQQIKNAYETLHMSQSNYIRLKIFTDAQPKFSDQRDIHAVRVIGITLTKIFKELKDTQLIPHKMMDIKQLITEIKLTVRRFNDRLDKS